MSIGFLYSPSKLPVSFWFFFSSASIHFFSRVAPRKYCNISRMKKAIMKNNAHRTETGKVFSSVLNIHAIAAPPNASFLALFDRSIVKFEYCSHISLLVATICHLLLKYHLHRFLYQGCQLYFHHCLNYPSRLILDLSQNCHLFRLPCLTPF